MALDLTMLGQDWLTSMTSALSEEAKWDEADLMRQQRVKVQRAFSSVGAEPPADVVQTLLREAREGAVPESPKLLRDLLASLHVPLELESSGEDSTHWSPIESVSLVTRLLEAAEQQPSRWRDRCMGAAMRSLLTYNPFADTASQSGRVSWGKVRAALRAYDAAAVAERFATALRPHAAILGDDPVAFYAERYFEGDGDSVRDALRGLGVPDTSWFWSELVLGQVRHLVRQPKDVFDARWEGILDEVELWPSLVDRGLALLLDRYVALSTVENRHLADLAFERWKNPLAPHNAQSWLARIERHTFEVVSGWIKLSLIDDFFSLLADDKDADQARVRYWKKKIDQITGIHVFIGEPGRNRTVALRRRMGTNARLLHGNTHAFAMTMGSYVFIEFSNSGNALYTYPRGFLDELRAGMLDIRALKDRRTIGPRRIPNNWTHQGNWEANFDERMRYLR